MTELPNGNLSSKELLEKLEKYLAELDTAAGLGPIVDSGIPQYLEMSQSVISKLEPDELNEGAYILRQHSLKIQRLKNKHSAIANFIERRIKKDIADQIDNYSGYGYEEKKFKAIKGSELYSRLAEIENFQKLKADALDMIAMHVGQVAKTMEELAATRRSIKS